MNEWNCATDHFLISDDVFHLCSGWHSHRGGGSRKKHKQINMVAIDDDKTLLRIIQDFIKLI